MIIREKFSKNFFGGRGRRGNGPEVAKHRTSLGKSPEVLHRKYGCLPQRSPMFLISEKGKVLNTDLSDFTMRTTYTPLDMHYPIALSSLSLLS